MPRTYLWSTLAASPGNPRALDGRLIRLGLAGWIGEHVAPALSRGFDGVILHHPGGLDAGEGGEGRTFDETMIAQESGLDLYTGAAPVLRVLSAGVRVVLYQGRLSAPRLRGLGNRTWWHRMEQSARLAIESGCGLAIDLSCECDERERAFMNSLTARGVRVYREAQPFRGNEMPDEVAGFICERALFARGSDLFAPLSPQMGEVVLWAQRHGQRWDETRWLVEARAEAHAAGHSFACAPDGFVHRGVSVLGPAAPPTDGGSDADQ